MRHIWMIAALVGCGAEYELHARCVAGDVYTVCPTEVSYREASRRCELLGQRVVSIDEGLVEQTLVEQLAEQELGADATWWGGDMAWLDQRFDGEPACPASQGAASGPRPCEEARPYVCEDI